MLYFRLAMKKIKGLTLVELIIGIVIVAIISVASFEFYRHCQRFVMDAEVRLGVSNFARETMEQRMWDADIATTGGLWIDDTALPTGTDFASDIGSNHGGTRQYSTDETSNYKVIKVKVHWNP